MQKRRESASRVKHGFFKHKLVVHLYTAIKSLQYNKCASKSLIVQLFTTENKSATKTVSVAQHQRKHMAASILNHFQKFHTMM